MAQTALKLPSALDAFVDEQVRSGVYPDRDSLIVDAVDRLREQMAEDEEGDKLKSTKLNAKLQAGIDSLDRGEGIVLTDIKAHFDEIMAEITRR